MGLDFNNSSFPHQDCDSHIKLGNISESESMGKLSVGLAKVSETLSICPNRRRDSEKKVGTMLIDSEEVRED